ncbi:pyridoxamine 5'-phosphate oxidase family protein [Alienimonas californiensis]|uniref:Pyridoxamine 5'-phosphate oxidase n=1 Tax=Alienimonas californiensis TaxID=2527989 RepID=A0A517P523_9PLAN|nr:pyridoxamine 5'-phosphate oxidase family protein [Alienimonas californiensis]QDT14461.1 Pyridoxamine 5'-phosphate oxidase [Alienimonas californiensis]
MANTDDQKPAPDGTAYPSDSEVPTDDLDRIVADLWERLSDAADRSQPAFHLPMLATIRTGPHGLEPSVRKVVLRFARRGPDRSLGGDAGEDVGGGTLGCHTDALGPKVAEIRANPRVAWTFYDPQARLQVRASGTARVLTDGPLVDAAWTATKPSARRCYLAPHVPGVPTDSPEPNLPAPVRKRDPTTAESEPGRAHFAALRTTIDALDWLHLHHAGHRRAQFRWDNGEWRGNWVAV